MPRHKGSVNLFRAILVLLCVSIATSGHGEDVDIKIVDEVNLIRQKIGLNPLFEESAASLAAESHAQELGQRHTLSHWGLDGSRVADRYRNSGGTGISAGENLGAGDSIGIILDAWMNSPSHRDNLIDPKWNSIGIGSYQLLGGRIVLVAVFTTSRWFTRSIEHTNGRLLLSGEYRIHGSFSIECVSLTVDGQEMTPIVISEDVNDATWILRFETEEPEGWRDGRWVPAELSCVDNGDHQKTDLLVLPPPGKRASP